MNNLCKTVKEAFYFDKEELASKSFLRLVRMYFGTLSYNALVNIRLSQYFYHKSGSVIARHFYKHLYKSINAFNYKNYGLNISFLADIGRNLTGYFRNISISAYTKIGKNVYIAAGVTICPRPRKGGSPVIGDNVYIYTGAVIVGVVKVNDNATIGANSLVIRSVPSNMTVIGVPAKIIKK